MKKIAIIVGSVLLLIIVGMLCMQGNERNTEVTKERTRVGFIYNGTIDDKGWGQSHYEGISESAKELNLQIMYKEKVPFDDTCMEEMQKMIDAGCKIIICNSFDYGDYIMKVAKENPDIKFYHATGVSTEKNVTTYFGRMYQMRYLSGVVAGMQTEKDSIGYVAAFPISEVNRGINAFTLGVQSVNPDAVVNVVYSESWTDYEANATAAKLLRDKYQVDVLAMHCDTVAPLDVAEEQKIWSIGYNMDNSEDYPDSFLTAAVWNWEAFYTPQLLKCLQGKFQSRQHWEGVETGIVSLSPLTSNAKSGIGKVLEKKRQELYNGTFDVFYGPIVDSQGNIRIQEGENMPDEAMLNSFGWYVKGVQVHEE
nr:BMP family ABC transporter substrate-binding protein [Eubacterium sp.]